MGAHSISRMNGFVIETFEINRIGTVNRDATAIDEPRHRIDQSKILNLIIASKGGRKNDERKSAARAEGQHFEITAQMGCPPADVTLLNGEKVERTDGIISPGRAGNR